MLSSGSGVLRGASHFETNEGKWKMLFDQNLSGYSLRCLKNEGHMYHLIHNKALNWKNKTVMFYTSEHAPTSAHLPTITWAFISTQIAGCMSWQVELMARFLF